MCDIGANRFVERYFHDCLYDARDGVGFAFGMASICFWLVAQLPQFVLNIQTQSVEALSSWFLAQWLLGDTCNLVGCLLTNSQLPTQTYTAMYFILADMAMMVQYIYYMALQRHQERLYLRRMLRQQRHLHYMHSQGDSATGSPLAGATSGGGRFSDEETGLLSSGSSGHLQTTSARPAAGSRRGAAARTFASLAVVALVRWGAGGIQPALSTGLLASGGSRRRSLLQHSGSLMVLGRRVPAWARLVGVWLGYVSSFFYLSSRMSQLYKNWARKCTEGLSVAMFLMAISANVCYGLGILIRTYSTAELWDSAPWLLGSLGVVALDVLISLQGVCYPASEKDPNRLREPLIVPTVPGREAFPSLSADFRRDR